MLAGFDGKNYVIITDRKKGEMENLPGNKLEAEHFFVKGKEAPNKKVTLEYRKNNGPDGVELTHLPEDRNSWNDTTEIRFKMNRTALYHALAKGKVESKLGDFIVSIEIGY